MAEKSFYGILKIISQHPKFAKRCENCKKKYLPPPLKKKHPYDVSKRLVKIDVFLSANLKNIINIDRDIRSQKL